MNTIGRTRWVILRDLVIFQIKLVLDGAKDIALAPLSIIAAALDLFFPGARPGHRFYGVMRLGERFDRWLSLFAAADKADAREDGLFGASRAGSSSLLGRLEAIALGHDEPVDATPAARATAAGGHGARNAASAAAARARHGRTASGV
jgi:hypothetical protein